MRISALLGVKNEEELIKRCVDHLFAIGVDDIVIEDYGSTDSTLDILKQYSQDLVKIVNFDESQDTSKEVWGSREAAIIRSIGADWVLLLDADEFWLPRTGSIRDGLRNSSAPVLKVNRYNVVLGTQGAHFPENLSPDLYDQVMCYVKEFDNFPKKLSASNSIAWIRGVPLPKIAVRPQLISSISAGHHSALDQDGKRFPDCLMEDVVIAHLPFTSFDRFQRKVENIRQSVELQPSYHSNSTGWHWKRWIGISNDGNLRAEFDRQLATKSDVQTLRNEGSVNSAAEIVHMTELVATETQQEKLKSPVRVSIHMPAYNHEKYISEAIESALMQETNFGFEIVIGEDHSTDGTLEIARRYARAHPDEIRLIENIENLGIWKNDQVIIDACQGEYIAWLESDDFWTSPHKLQKQVDFLDANRDHSACFHRAFCLTYSEPPITWKGDPPTLKQSYELDDLLEHGHFIPSCTGVFRTKLVRSPLEWTQGTPFLETAYAVRFALGGALGYLDEEMATFRFHSQGIYGSATKIRNIQNAIDAHLLVGRGFKLTTRPAYRKGLARMYAQLSNQQLKENHYV